MTFIDIKNGFYTKFWVGIGVVGIDLIHDASITHIVVSMVLPCFCLVIFGGNGDKKWPVCANSFGLTRLISCSFFQFRFVGQKLAN